MRQITWPECWPLIGWGRSRELNADLWLVDVGTDPGHTSITCQFEPLRTWPAIAWTLGQQWWLLIGLLASTNCHGLQDLFGKEKEEGYLLYIVSVSAPRAQNFTTGDMWRVLCVWGNHYFTSFDVFKSNISASLTFLASVFAKLMFSLNGMQDTRTHKLSLYFNWALRQWQTSILSQNMLLLIKVNKTEQGLSRISKLYQAHNDTMAVSEPNTGLIE